MLALTGCTFPGQQSDPQPKRVETETSSPTAELTVVAGATDRVASIEASSALFDESSVVVVAPSGNVAAQEVAAQASVGMGVPLLIAEAGGSTADESATPGPDASPADTALAAELTRLGASAVVVVGPVTGLPAEGADDEPLSVVRVAAKAAAVGKALGMKLANVQPTDAVGSVARVAALAPGEPSRKVPNADAASAVPAVERARTLDDVVTLAIDAPEHIAGIATARAAGVPVHLLPAASVNPQTSPAVIEALHSTMADKTLVFGAAFQAEPALDWKIRSARTGVQLPGGGQVLFPQHQFVAIYGVPGSGALGILGEQDSTAAVQRAKDVAAPYQALTEKTVVPMFEMMATIASATAGDDGNYSAELPLDQLRPWIDEAAAAGLYVVIDLQPGRTDFLTQAKLYQPLLELPNVGLALDPEWRLKPDQVHLRQIGSVAAAEVNSVIQWLADLTNEKGLPQKMLVLHQFQLRMIQDRAALDMSRPELAILIHADGQGAQPDKQATWNALREDAPPGVAWGWKNFYDEDLPVLSPEQTMRGVTPVPDLVTYQ
jgi:hypothetical protein